MDSNKLKFLMMAFDQIQTLKIADPNDPNLHEIETLFYKHAPDYFSFQTLRLSDMYDSSFEHTIKDQASTFYNNFQSFKVLPTNIQRQLLDDYYQMELQRRRNNFERFSQCIFQQIECIVTHFWDNGKLFNFININRQRNTFASKAKQIGRNYTLIPNDQKPLLQDEIFAFRGANNRKFSDQQYDSYFSKQTIEYKALNFKVKLRAFIYFCYFDGSPLKDDYYSVIKPLIELNAVRNLFHRGPENFYPTQQKLIDDVQAMQPIYFLKFYGVLSDFINKGLNSTNLNKII